MNFDRFCELFPKANFVRIAPFNEEELFDEGLRKKNKIPLDSLKKPLDIAQARNWLDRGGRLGWIVPKKYIAIDIDNKDHPDSAKTIEKLLENHSVNYFANYSKQGTHFIFKNTSEIMKGRGQFQGYINHIGIGTDGRADNKGYIILPTNDEKNGRVWAKWDAEELDDLPFWLRPMRIRRTEENSTNPDVSFIGMADGAGNESLFKLRGAHSVPNLITDEESIECLRIINWEIWTNPMSEESFDATVARPVEKTYDNMQAIDGTGNKTPKTSTWLEIAQKLIKEQNLIAVGDFVYKYHDGIYEKMSPHELHELIHKKGYLYATRAQRQEIIEFMCVQKQINPLLLDREYACIPCANGYLDLLNFKLVEPNPEDYNTVRVDIPFNPQCQYSELIDDFMKFISNGDPEVMKQLYEIAGYCLVRKNNFHKFFILVGGGGTGKSTYCNILRRMFKPKYVTKVALSQFDQDYYLSMLIDSMINIDDDASNEKILKDAGRFKSAVAGMPITVRPIYSEPIDLECRATIIVCSNSMPRIQDDSEGLYRRMLLVELNNRIKNPDRDFEKKITDLDMEYFFYKAAEAIHHVLKRSEFTMEESEEMLKQKFKVQQSSINKWCQLECITVETLIGQGLKVVYKDYRMWCEECGYSPFNYGNFVEAMVHQYQLTTEYDRGLMDQVVTKSLLPNDFCPFDQSLTSNYY